MCPRRVGPQSRRDPSRRTRPGPVRLWSWATAPGHLLTPPHPGHTSDCIVPTVLGPTALGPTVLGPVRHMSNSLSGSAVHTTNANRPLAPFLPPDPVCPSRKPFLTDLQSSVPLGSPVVWCRFLSASGKDRGHGYVPRSTLLKPRSGSTRARTQTTCPGRNAQHVLVSETPVVPAPASSDGPPRTRRGSVQPVTSRRRGDSEQCMEVEDLRRQGGRGRTYRPYRDCPNRVLGSTVPPVQSVSDLRSSGRYETVAA